MTMVTGVKPPSRLTPGSNTELLIHPTEASLCTSALFRSATVKMRVKYLFYIVAIVFIDILDSFHS